MKKLLCLFTLAALMAGGSLFAQKGGFADPSKGGRGGFQGDGELRAENRMIIEVKQAPDDTVVAMTGWLIEQLDDDTYLFKTPHSSETIVVEIDEDKWRGLTVTPADKVILLGEVDRDGDKVKVDVKRIRKADGHKQGKADGHKQGKPGAKGDKAGVKGDKVGAAGCTDCGCAAAPKK